MLGFAKSYSSFSDVNRRVPAVFSFTRVVTIILSDCRFEIPVLFWTFGFKYLLMQSLGYDCGYTEVFSCYFGAPVGTKPLIPLKETIKNAKSGPFRLVYNPHSPQLCL